MFLDSILSTRAGFSICRSNFSQGPYSNIIHTLILKRWRISHRNLATFWYIFKWDSPEIAVQFDHGPVFQRGCEKKYRIYENGLLKKEGNETLLLYHIWNYVISFCQLNGFAYVDHQSSPYIYWRFQYHRSTFKKSST